MRKLKKMLAAAIACVTVISMLSGCAGKEEPQPTVDQDEVKEEVNEESVDTGFTDAGTSETETVEDAPSFKLGFIHTSFSDQLGVMYQKYAQYAADQLGCEIIFIEASDADARMSALQNMIEMEVQGVIMTSCSESILQMCADAGVYYIQVGNTISDTDLAAYAQNCEYFIGNCLVDNYQVGYNMVEALYEQGCRKLAFLEFTPGQATTMDDRARGMQECVDSHEDLDVVTVYTGAPTTFADGAEQVLSAYGSQLDGIASVMASAAIPSAIFTSGYASQIKYAGVDIQEGTDELLETGAMSYVAGGAFPNAEICVAMLYNYLTDYKIWTDDEDVTRPLIELQNVEDYEHYMKYFEGSLPCYTGDEIKAIVGIYNEDVTMEDVRALAADSSLESCVKRHEGLID